MPRVERTAISIRIDTEILKKVKANAEKVGMPYQTYINALLHFDAREPTFGQDKSICDRLGEMTAKLTKLVEE